MLALTEYDLPDLGRVILGILSVNDFVPRTVLDIKNLRSVPIDLLVRLLRATRDLLLRHLELWLQRALRQFKSLTPQPVPAAPPRAIPGFSPIYILD